MSEILPILSLVGPPILGVMSAYIAVKVMLASLAEQNESTKIRVERLELDSSERRVEEAEIRERIVRLETKIDVLLMRSQSAGAAE